MTIFLKVNSVDITSTNLLTSEQFKSSLVISLLPTQIMPESRTVGIIGNTGNLLSVLSFILTSIVLITSNNMKNQYVDLNEDSIDYKWNN